METETDADKLRRLRACALDILHAAHWVLAPGSSYNDLALLRHTACNLKFVLGVKDASNLPVPECRWYAAMVECRVCSHRQSSYWPVGADGDNLQCSKCGNMTCHQIDE